MIERISSIVLQIQGKFHDLHNQLTIEREKNNLLEIELKQAKILLSANQKDIFQLNEEKLDLQNKIVLLNEQFELQKSESLKNRDSEIEELVREIDHCISQLKQ